MTSISSPALGSIASLSRNGGLPGNGKEGREGKEARLELGKLVPKLNGTNGEPRRRQTGRVGATTWTRQDTPAGMEFAGSNVTYCPALVHPSLP